MDHFAIGDCISHAEDLAVVREQLYCYACNQRGPYVYLAVFRGILLAVVDNLAEAKQMLDGMNVEKIALWYHDLYRRYRFERRDKSELEGFLRDLLKWYTETDKRESLYFLVHDTYFKETTDPIDAVRRFLAERDAPQDDREDRLF
jgi:hypothetical protein